MDANDQSHLLSSIKLMRELTHAITDEARALFSPRLPAGHTLDVVVSKKRGPGGAEYEARLVAYTESEAGHLYGRWTLLAANPRICEGPVDAMTDLLEALYEDVGSVVGRMDVGDVYDGQGQSGLGTAGIDGR